MGSERGFGIVFCCFFLLVALWPVLHGTGPRLWALAIAARFLAVGLPRPPLPAPPTRCGFRVALLLGQAVPPHVPVLVFVLTVMPTGMVMRLLGKDPLRRKIDKSAASYWVSRDAPPGPMRNQF